MRTNDHKVALKFLKEPIFSRFGMPHAIISDGELHFCNRLFEKTLKKIWNHPQSFHDLPPTDQWSSRIS